MVPRIEISSGTHNRQFPQGCGKGVRNIPTGSRSPTIPEPTTSASRNAVPTNSARTGVFKLNLIADRCYPVLSSTQGSLRRQAGDKGKGRFSDRADRKHPGRLSGLLPVCLRPRRDREHPNVQSSAGPATPGKPRSRHYHRRWKQTGVLGHLFSQTRPNSCCEIHLSEYVRLQADAMPLGAPSCWMAPGTISLELGSPLEIHDPLGHDRP